MTDVRTMDVGVEFLERLLERSERNPDRSRPASATPDYDSLSTAQQVSRFHDQMAAAERFGAVEVQWGKRDRSHLIERVRVRDPELLARHLGRPTAPAIARRLREDLLPLAVAGEPWVVSLLDEMTARWARNEAAYRLTAGQADAGKEFFTLLASICRQEARGLDARTFSQKATNDTKAFDRHASRLAAVLGVRMGQPGAAADVVWAHVGLERFSHPIHLKGLVAVEGARGRLVDGRAKPFASIHPEMLSQLAILEPPTAILTIENFASFNRQVREIEDGSLVVYTGGFPAAGVIELLAKVLALVPAEVPFLHWGDVDAGGARIFRYMEESLPRGPRPHLMTKELAEKAGSPADADPSLASIARSDSAIKDLAEWLAFGSAVRHLEQEALDPEAPSHAVASSAPQSVQLDAGAAGIHAERNPC
ncbi:MULTISPECIES: Wadjet anti-phage system protein JetD domain-containing protein [unclassified Bradyrhizobium]|uniref:Wadjet anti-phage system protein JetD domain-containing protein n=1 Tax=unclassified Bradyrhizobium TaxID=2631580 RepID=UPI002305F3B5|nr:MULTISPECIES: Wadjet anti-phage system protein JetD domain-containing protein [unclassified Bradyrhizobium]